jgi:hypothetical protein
MVEEDNVFLFCEGSGVAVQGSFENPGVGQLRSSPSLSAIFKGMSLIIACVPKVNVFFYSVYKAYNQ